MRKNCWFNSQRFRSALNQTTGRLLENHMETCVAECIRVGQGEKALRHLKGALGQVVKNL